MLSARFCRMRNMTVHDKERVSKIVLKHKVITLRLRLSAT
jgi:hypothetical protein